MEPDTVTTPDTRPWWRRRWDALDADDLVLLSALTLLAIGFWLAWRPGAFLVPGLVLLWLVLPPRAPFVARPTVTGQADEKPAARRTT